MRQLLLGLGISAVFVAGCVAGASNLGVKSAQAEAGSSDERWAYLCIDARTAGDVHVKANAAGAEGWDMVSAGQGDEGQLIWCFRRPAR